MARTVLPLRDFFRTPQQTSFKISPDGRYLSYLAPWSAASGQPGRQNVFVEPIASRTMGAQRTIGAEGTRITSETDRDIGGHWWKSADRILYVRDFGGDENYHLFAVDRDGANARDLTPFEGVRVEVIDELEQSADELLIRMNQRDASLFDVYRLNVVTGALRMVAENPGDKSVHGIVTRWITDHDGVVRIAVATDGVNNTILYRDDETQEFRAVITTHFKESLDPMFFAFSTNGADDAARKTCCYAMSNIGRDRIAIVMFDLATGKELEVIFEHPEVDVEGIAYSKKRKVLTAISCTTWKQEIFYQDDEIRQLYARVLARLPNYEISVIDHTRDEKTYILRSYSDRSLGAYYLYDFDGDVLTLLAEVSPWLKEEDLAPMKPVSFQSRDGLTIHGYLTVPVGSEGKDLPVVVNPHGGPWHRDRWTYNPEVQFLVNRGYAVFQINFRGSTGYGRKFWEASFKQWGRTMQDDVTDGVQWLIKEGVADPKRVAIYGGSYGGYCTLAGLTFTPELYACGVDYVGVSNLFTFLQTIPPYWKPYLESMYEMVGHPERDRELLEASSPVFHADQIRAPLMVIQGAKDPRVNIDESNQIVEALRKRGIEVPYIVKENEGHGFHNEENRFEVYEAMEAFFKKHLA